VKPRYISLEPLIQWRIGPRPLDLRSLFGREAPVEVEIGFGSGDYLVKQAMEQPHKNFIGIEVAWLSIRNALRKIALCQANNVRVIQGDARVLFKRLFHQQSLDKVYCLFPCPWPKKRHIKHRLFDASFLKLMNSRLKDSGIAVIVTDHRPYYEWILEQTQSSGFEITTDTCPPGYSTKYEKKWLEQGQMEFFRIKMKKIVHLKIPVEEDIALKTHILEDFSPEHFQPKGRKNLAVVEFKESLYDPLRQKAMVRAMVAEGSFVQNFWIEIIRDGTRWRIRPARGCSIVPTVGVQEALDFLYESIRQDNSASQKRENTGIS